jgi:hypothetical protein
MKTASFDKELDAAKTILHALETFDEAQQRFVIKTVTDRLGLSIATNPPQGGATPASQTGAAPSSGSLDGQTAKQFLKAKLPKTDVQRIACLAYYQTNGKKQPHFKTEDLTNLNTEAGGIRLSNASQAVSNAQHQNGFITSAGSGKCQITTIGEDLVDALPDQAAVKIVLAKHRKPRKKHTKKDSAKAK